MRSILASFIAAVLASGSPPTSAPVVSVPCAETGQTLTSGPQSRLYRDGADVYGCWDESGEPRLLDRTDIVASPRVAGRFAAYVAGPTVRVADLRTGRTAGFPQPEGRGVEALVLGRFGRVAWIVSDGASYELHRADLAGRDRLLDSGTAINPRSLRIVRGGVQWRADDRLRHADLDGSQGDKSPIEDAHLRLVPGTTDPHGPGPLSWRYGVEVEDGLPIDHERFAEAVDRILFDERSWVGPGSRISLQRVDEPPFDFTVTLAKPSSVNRLCLPLHTGGRVSCQNRSRSVLNWLRWSTGSTYWSSKALYRRYLVNHEVGHSLGHRHRFCGGRGQIAPIMQQQTGPAAPCVHAQWPKRFERRLTRAP